MRINFDFYKHPENVPLTELAKILGLERDKTGNYKCPCHNDTNPSFRINETGKYANKFKCFGCGESGDALLLTLAVRSQIIPSEYFRNKKDYQEQIKDAALFIEQYFPGAIIQTEKEQQNTKETGPKLPAISYKILKEIGLSANPFMQNYTKMYPQYLLSKMEYQYIENHQLNPMVKIDPLETLDAVHMVYDKLANYLDTTRQVTNEFIQKYYPDMPLEGRKYINKMDAQRYDEALELFQQLQKYIDYYDKETCIDGQIENDIDDFEKGE